ncbi:hypothetical protein [Paenibacillus durus]|uniref:Uncharacterized protein n=1 Tax=Paenibacillus durus TaxID=44251 RepID=A0A089HJM2_PAEDU|nr:hypothetical protein [Paenibacillus durus]AIQ11297.1 hypothetical protein PDUR_04285 [Paenibacillus durus]
MYLNKAIEKINNVKWDEVGTIVSEEDADLGREFLRRAAQFYKEESIKPLKPMFTHIAKLLGDTEEGVDISKYCSSKALELLVKNTSAKRIFEFYIQLAKYVDENPEYQKYLSVYEPLIRIFEKGGLFVFRMHELEIKNVAYISMNGWYERFVEMEPIDIDEL